MPPMVSPPEGYTCNVLGFDNIPVADIKDRMPTPGAIPTPTSDNRMDDSNTTKLPVPGPAMPKGM